MVVSAVEGDGIKIPFDIQSNDPVILRTHTRIVDFVFNPQSKDFGSNTTESTRYRYKLEGFDRQWLNPIGVMRFAVRFNDNSENTISGEEFDAHGESQGWTFDLTTSPVVSRKVTLAVPEGASRLQIWLNSAGPHQTMGVYALCDLVAELLPADPSAQPRRVNLIPLEGSLMESAAGTPKGWARHGTSLGIAQLVARPGTSPWLTLRDDRHDAFGGWLTKGSGSVNLSGVARIVLEWREAYSIGWGGSARVSYPYLPAGDYQMRIQPATIEGRVAVPESVMRVKVVPPLHERNGFRAILAALGAAGVAMAVRALTRKRMQRRLDALEREHAIERERGRIARDLHDNLGADLTHLALLSDLARIDSSNPSKASENFDLIFDLAQVLTRKVDEIVWAVNPANDSVRGFVPFLISHTQNYLRAAGISCRMAIPEDLTEHPLTSTQRHHLFLVVKETLHNVVKHANASEVWLRIRTDAATLHIEIEDNGRGSNPIPATGDGVQNMRKRLDELGGHIAWESRATGGTRVRLGLPLSATPKQSAD
jgi:signal transduction histidine kinase